MESWLDCLQDEPESEEMESWLDPIFIFFLYPDYFCWDTMVTALKSRSRILASDKALDLGSLEVFSMK